MDLDEEDLDLDEKDGKSDKKSNVSPDKTTKRGDDIDSEDEKTQKDQKEPKEERKSEGLSFSAGDSEGDQEGEFDREPPSSEEEDVFDKFEEGDKIEGDQTRPRDLEETKAQTKPNTNLVAVQDPEEEKKGGQAPGGQGPEEQQQPPREVDPKMHGWTRSIIFFMVGLIFILTMAFLQFL